MNLIVRSALSLCMIMTLGACQDTPKEQKKQKVTVNVARTEAKPADSKKEFSFISEPFRSSELSFRVGGPIDRFEVYAGNYYNRGDIIAEIDPRDFHIRKERAEGIYSQAKTEYERIRILYEKNNVSASSFEKAKADYIAAKTNYETTVNELEDTKLVAPFNGYVGEVFIEKFQDVKATQPVITFVDLDQLKIEAYVTQDIAINYMQNQTKIDLRFDAIPNTEFEAKVIEISKSTTPNNLSFLLTAMLPNKERKLLSGMSGKVFFDLSGNDVNKVLTIPQASVNHRPNEGDFVWVVDPSTGLVNRRGITTGRLLPDGVICVESGLEAGEMVATSSLRFLSDGMFVNVASRVY